MLTLIFEKHPGDLLQVTGNKNTPYLKINQFSLKVNGMIKLTPQLTFKVSVSFPSNKVHRESLLKTLNNWVADGEINSYTQ